MNTITIDRSVVEQALNSMDKATRFMSDSDYKKLNQAIEDLKAALTEPVQEPGTPATVANLARDIHAAVLRRREGGREPTQEPYCHVYEYDSPLGIHRTLYPKKHNGKQPHRAIPLYAAPPQQPEPVQEPVAWMYTGIKQDGTEHGPHLVWKPAYMDAMSASKGVQATPLYTTPPQRKPLTEGKPWVCACGANLYIGADGEPRSKA